MVYRGRCIELISHYLVVDKTRTDRLMSFAAGFMITAAALWGMF